MNSTAAEIAHKLNAKRSGNGWRAKCPAHNGSNTTSLSIGEGSGGRILLRCNSAGCTYQEIMEALGIDAPRPAHRLKRKPFSYEAPTFNAKLLWETCRALVNQDQNKLQNWADLLKLPASAIDGMGAACLADKLIFPMHDGKGDICGIRTRLPSHDKRAITGSKAGVFLPTFNAGDYPVICEGPTDAAAAIAYEMEPIGRPSCTGCEKHVVDTCRRFKYDRITICADQDGPGLAGARKLNQALHAARIQTKLVTPLGGKDLRECWTAGVTAIALKAAWEQAEWRIN